MEQKVSKDALPVMDMQVAIISKLPEAEDFTTE
jgi:hypothetical protein